MKLIEPDLQYEQDFAQFEAEFAAAGETFIHGIGGMSARDGLDFNARVQRSLDAPKGINLPEGHVPASTYWLIEDGRILGTINFRHELNDHLRVHGGHIGYAVRPAERGKGYATLMLKLTLEKARQRGLKRILLTCTKENTASAKTMIANGAVFEKEAYLPDDDETLHYYWIDL